MSQEYNRHLATKRPEPASVVHMAAYAEWPNCALCGLSLGSARSSEFGPVYSFITHNVTCKRCKATKAFREMLLEQELTK